MRDIPDEDPSRPYIVQNILVTRETLDAAQENLRGAAIEAFGRSNIGHVGFRMYPNINGNNVTQAVVGFTKPADEIAVASSCAIGFWLAETKRADMRQRVMWRLRSISPSPLRRPHSD